ncbi:hypothetical protein [Halorubrum sp. AJ67]|uniref:hypothetical protein n=1 Tax=Halorubrum sp. AJ67 TaxID=1173487 RepID=UPI0003DCFC5B|nr:hypothetical protein [Halorubrum sp. AJ67]CDK38284.1 hypothetical protein BN903_484 [Halorubrum sp. AJ67]
MGINDVKNISQGDELIIDGKEAVVQSPIGTEFTVAYPNGGTETFSTHKIQHLVKEEDLDHEHHVATFIPYFAKFTHRVAHKTGEEFDEPMVNIRDAGHSIECVFNAAAAERGSLGQYQYANLYVSDQPYVFAISPATESATHSGTVELTHHTVDITKLADSLGFKTYYWKEGMGDHRWLPTQWDEVNEMYTIDASCLTRDPIIDRKANRE